MIDFLVSSLKRVPPHVMTLLFPAACMGHTFSMATIRLLPSCASLGSLLENGVQIALHQGFLVHLKESTYKFQHDRVQQAVYSLISDRERQQLHLEIGRVLLKQFVKANESGHDMFVVMDHINHAVDIIAAEDFDNKEKEHICVLNLKAGVLAKESGAHEIALKYINAGM